MREVKRCNNQLLRHATITKSKYKGHQRLKALYSSEKGITTKFGFRNKGWGTALNNNPL